MREDSETVSPAIRLGERERLFAAWIGVGVIMIVARLRVLQYVDSLDNASFSRTSGLVYYLPLAIYQDMLLLAALSWASWLTLSWLRNPLARRVTYIAGWVLCTFVACYAVLNAIIFRFFESPLTYHHIVLARHMPDIRDSLVEATNAVRIAKTLSAAVVVILAAKLIPRYAPRLLSHFAHAFHSPIGAVCLVVYSLGCAMWAVQYDSIRAVFYNPEWRFCQSFLDAKEPLVTGNFPAQYLSDFLPIGQRPSRTLTSAALTNVPPSTSTWRPRNVVMVVGESLGSHYMGLYGAPYANTPQMEQLARQSAIFRRLYVSTPASDDAIPALVCSLYPYHSWDFTTNLSPDLAVPGIATVLDSHGYRTAVIHSGILGDLEARFFRHHGFTNVYDQANLPGFQPEPTTGNVLTSLTKRPAIVDNKLLPAAMNWIDADRSRRFFLMLWTNDTHHPYAPPSHDEYRTGDPYLDRYLSAVKETDAIVGNLVRELKARGLIDDTIVVVTGDHGEQFGQHGRLAHGWSLYEEEVRVPLLIYNPHLFPNEKNVTRISRQIDIAPTLLGLLGFDPPLQWQGNDSFDADYPSRVYLFSEFVFGMAEGNLKYIYDAEKGGNVELYDLSRDPDERNNLVGDSAYSRQTKDAYERITAWSSFQNRYLDKFTPADKPRVTAGGKTSRDLAGSTQLDQNRTGN